MPGRVSQAGSEVLYKAPRPDLDTTQGGVVVGMTFARPDVDVTIGGVVVAMRNGPLRPTLTVTPSTATALLTGSTYAHLESLPHLRTEFEVASDANFTTIVYSNEDVYGGTPEDPPEDTATGLSPITTYWARIRYYAADGWSEYDTVSFDTTALSGTWIYWPHRRRRSQPHKDRLR